MFEFTKVFAVSAQQAADVAASDAAAATNAQTTLSSLGPILMMVALFAIMYFILIRPQKKKEKEAQAMIAALAVGDKIVTIGGIWGKVVKIKDDFIIIETGNIGNPNERTILKMERQAVKLVEKKTDSKKVDSIEEPSDNKDSQ